MLVKAILFIALAAFVEGQNDSDNRSLPPDMGLNVVQLIEKHGYPFENHTVITEDGYILEIHRIQHGKSGAGNSVRPPVLIVPGIICSSADWVNMGPKRSFGFILADQGYDVWVANYRGTRWSRKHATLNPDKDRKEYWSFNLHQIGFYDLPAFINYILNVTGQKKLFYIGYSQGSTTFFILTTSRPEYNEKIQLAVNIGPVAYFGHTTSPLIYLLAIFKNQIEELVSTSNFYELFPNNRNFALLTSTICQDQATTQDICVEIFYAINGYAPDQLNKTMLPVITTNSPGSSSIYQMLHYTQLYLSNKFQNYDYGEETNLQTYGQSQPPEYDLGKITTTLAFYCGTKDPYCRKEDVDRTASEVSNLVVNKVVQGFGHLDYMWGNDAVRLLYTDVLKLLKDYQK